MSKARLENGWNAKQMITEGEAAIPQETALHAFRNQEKTKLRSTIVVSTKHFGPKGAKEKFYIRFFDML